jgi:hypothetical protein
MLIYSTKRMAYAGAGLSFILFAGMLISFLRDFSKRLLASSGSTLIFGILGGALICAVLGTLLYAAYRVFRPVVVQGVIEKTISAFVRYKMNNDLEIQIDGKRYRLPLDRGARTKLNSVPADTVRVRLEVGAFRYVLSLKTQ